MSSSVCFFLCFFPPGDVPYEAHVQTHNGGARGVPSFPPAQNRASRHPHTDLAHLSSPRQRHFSATFSSDGLQTHSWVQKKCATLYRCFVKRCAFRGNPPFLSCWPDSIIGDIQRWFLSTFRPRNDRPKKLFFYVTSREKKKCSRQLHGKSFCSAIDCIIFFHHLFAREKCFRQKTSSISWITKWSGHCWYEMYSCKLRHFLGQYL